MSDKSDRNRFVSPVTRSAENVFTLYDDLDSVAYSELLRLGCTDRYLQ